MTHNVMLPNAVAAMNVDAWNRSGVCASAVDNGNIVILSALSTTAGEAEVWTALVPSSSNGLTGVWMVGEPDIVVTNAQYKGRDPDPRNFFVAATKIFSCFKPQLGDIITMTADGMSGSKGGSDTHVNATNSTGGLVLVWGTSQTASVFSMKLIETTYISIATGGINSQRVTAYKFEVVGL
jgi:hypothetical protein